MKKILLLTTLTFLHILIGGGEESSSFKQERTNELYKEIFKTEVTSLDPFMKKPSSPKEKNDFLDKQIREASEEYFEQLKMSHVRKDDESALKAKLRMQALQNIKQSYNTPMDEDLLF